MTNNRVYKQSDVSEADIFGLITQSAEKASEKIQLVDAQIVKFAEHSKALMNTADGKTIGGINQVIALNKDLQKQVTETIKLEKDKIKLEQLNTKLASDEIRLTTKKIQVEQQHAKSLKRTSVEQAILNEKQRQATAQTKAIAQLRNAEKGSLDALNAKMKLIEQAYNRLTPAQIENTKQGQRYLASLTAVRAELAKQQQAYGKHNMDVGNYKKAFDGLGFSVSQLAREMPAFANSMQTGFMAISNNLPMFFDEINKIKQANVELKASGQPTVSVLSQVGSAIFSVQSLLSIGVTLLTVYGAKLVESIGGMFGFGKEAEKLAQKKKYLNEQTKKSYEFISKESSEFVGNLMKLANTNKASKERSKLISEINAKYGTTLKNLQDEAKFQAQINGEVDKYIEFQKQRFKIQQYQEKIEINLKKQLDLETKINDNQRLKRQALDLIKEEQVLLANANKEAGAFDKNSEDNIKRRISMLRTSIMLREKEVDGFNKELISADERLKSYGFGLLDAQTKADDFGYTTEKTTKSLKSQAKAWEAINTQLEKLDKLKEYTDFAKEMNQLDFDITTTVNGQELDKVTKNLSKFIEEQKTIIANGGALNTDLIDDYINYEYELRQRQILRTRDFKLDQLQKDFATEKDLAYKAIEEETAQLIKGAEDQRKELLTQDNLTKSQRLAIQKEYEKSIEEIGKSRLSKIDDLNEIYIDKEKLRNKEEQKIVVESNAEIEKSKEEHNEKIISVNDDLIDAEIEQAKKSNDEKAKLREEEEKAEKEAQKRLAEFRKNMINEGLDQWKKASEEREKLIDREISASEKLADDLRQQANNGTIQANQSLAEQNRITNEKIQQKQKEQRIQQQIEEIKLLYNATEQYLQAGDTLPVAGSKAFLQVKGIKFLAQSLTGFFKGTKRTIGEELGTPQLSGKDGHIVRVDGSEMVFNGDLTNKVMSVNPSATTDEIVDTYVKSKTSNKAPVFIQNSTADERLLKKVDELNTTIKNKTEFTMHGESISNTLFQIVSTEKKGADLIKTRHIFKRNLS
jgi:hypothetical protein